MNFDLPISLGYSPRLRNAIAEEARATIAQLYPMATEVQNAALEHRVTLLEREIVALKARIGM